MNDMEIALVEAKTIFENIYDLLKGQETLTNSEGFVCRIAKNWLDKNTKPTITYGLALCECGHTRSAHIYEEGACRPGFECDDECQKFEIKK